MPKRPRTFRDLHPSNPRITNSPRNSKRSSKLEPEPPGKQKPPPPKEASPFVRNYVFAPADKQHVMTGRGKAFHAGNQPPFTMEAFFRPPWIYPLMAWIFTMFMWLPSLGPGAVK